MDEYNFKHIPLTKKSKGLIGLWLELLKHDYKLFKIAVKFKPDILLAFGGMSISHVGILLKKPSVSFYDTEHAKLIKLVTFSFISRICTPSAFTHSFGKKHRRFNSYKELAYLHPNYYKPDKKILKKLKIKKNEKYFILRFVSWDASHDLGIKRITIDVKRELISYLKKHGKVFISAEDNELPKDFQRYLLKINPSELFDAISFSELVISEGGTIATESAVLGIPTIYINPLSSGNLEEEKNKYKLLYQTINEEELFVILKKMLSSINLKKIWQKRRKILLKDKVDLTKWMINFVESYMKFKKTKLFKEIKTNRIHHTAEVSKDVVIGERTYIWNNAQIRERAVIGKDSIISKNVYIDTNVRIGNKVKIQNNTSIYRGVSIGDGVFVGPHVCFTNDKNPRAINPDNTLKSTNDWKVLETLVKKGASIGAHSVILPGIVIGKFALIGAGSTVTKNVPDYGLALGNPAAMRGYVCKCGYRLKKEQSCKQCNTFLKNGKIIENDSNI